MRKMILAATLAALPALAHHGWSEYDSSRPLTLTGKVVASGYEHPHGHIRLEAPGKTWLVILAPPSRMESRGLPAISRARPHPSFRKRMMPISMRLPPALATLIRRCATILPSPSGPGGFAANI